MITGREAQPSNLKPHHSSVATLYVCTCQEAARIAAAALKGVGDVEEGSTECGERSSLCEEVRNDGEADIERSLAQDGHTDSYHRHGT
jgi:hypothetical protein